MSQLAIYSFFGEPPARGIDVEIDANHRLRRMYHGAAPGSYRRDETKSNKSGGVRLGEAVAASACVPGLFDPILLDDLYGALGKTAEEYRTRLVGRMLRYRNSYLDLFIAFVMCSVGWIVFYPYLYVIDPLYVKWGSTTGTGTADSGKQ